MKWFISLINSFRPWVVTVSFDGGPQEVFAECWKKEVAQQIFIAQRDHVPFNDGDPRGQYRLVSRAEWNNQKS